MTSVVENKTKIWNEQNLNVTKLLMLLRLTWEHFHQSEIIMIHNHPIGEQLGIAKHLAEKSSHLFAENNYPFEKLNHLVEEDESHGPWLHVFRVHRSFGSNASRLFSLIFRTFVQIRLRKWSSFV